jgi:hypothetical protein
MSVTFDLLCVRCGERAPEVGDFGYIGSPSLSSLPRFVPWRPQRFGYIYRGLSDVSLMPAEVAAFHAFLRKHRGHRLFATPGADDDDGEGGFLSNMRIWVSMGLSVIRHPSVLLRRGLQGTLEFFLGGSEDEPSDPSALITEADFVMARYRMTCTTCGRSVVTENSDSLRQFERRNLLPKEVAAFERRVLSLDADDIYRATPLIDPGYDLRPFQAFVREHAKHKLEADLVLDKGAS